MKRLLAIFLFAFCIFLFNAQTSFAFDSFTVLNPRVVDGRLTVDINPSPPDNICSWWHQLHFVYLTNSVGNRVGGFGGSCINNSDGTYTFTDGDSGGYLPDTGTYRVEVYLSEFSYDALSSTFEWTSPVPHVNRPPSLQLFDSAQPVVDLPQYLRVHINLGETYSVNGSFTDIDSTSWTAAVDYGNGEGFQPLSLNGNSFSLNYVYPRGGSYFAIVKVTDDQGAVGEILRVVTILDYTIVASNPRVVNGGFAVDLHGFPPDNICSWFPAFRHDAYILDLNDQRVGGFLSCSNNPDGSYTVASGNVGGQVNLPSGTYKIKIEEREQPPYPYVAISSSFVWIHNQPSYVNPLSGATITAGGTYSENGSFTDSDSTSWTATVDYDEGAGPQPLGLNGMNFILNHQYASAGAYTVAVVVRDSEQNTGTTMTDVIVVAPTPTPTNTPTNTPTPTPTNTPTPTATPTPSTQLTTLTPAKVWIGLKNSDDVGTKFDLKVEAYKDSTLVSSGQVNSFTGGSSGFNNAHLATINFDSFSPVNFPSGSVLSLKVYVRNACTGSGHNSGVARLWYNDSQADSRFGATIGGNSLIEYLRDGFVLATTTGTVKKTIDVQSGAKCSAFKPFGTWSITP